VAKWKQKRPILDRFVDFIDFNLADNDNGCWQWLGSQKSKGYGAFAVDGKTMCAHRVSWELAVGPIPAGMEMDHLCRNPGCVNPDHLEVVTRRENSLRGMSFAGVNARKTHCPQGHPYDEENTSTNTTTGGRLCRSCCRARSKERCRMLSGWYERPHRRSPGEGHLHGPEGDE
jgi:hypothetical protein